jgi:predicted metal-dependent peptidase
MNEDQLKSLLISLEECQIDFSIEFVAAKLKAGTAKIKMGDYNEQTHLIRLFCGRHAEYRTLIDTVIHEYTHHLLWEYWHFGRITKRVLHGEEFWLKYNELISKAKIKGYFAEKSTDADSRISEIVESWFIREPLMMLTMLLHEVTINTKIANFRCGQGRIEYNPNYSKFLTKEQVEERLKSEVIRILLNHPYRHHTDKRIAYQASNITINEFYHFVELVPRAKDFWQTPDFYKQNFEFYVRELNNLSPNRYADNADPCGYEEKIIRGNPSNQRNLRDENEGAELWQEDGFMPQKINEIIENAASDTTQWGSIPEYLIRTLIANLKPAVDYRKILRSFRASILSSKNVLTRFKPSRRYGWAYMGKKNDFSTHLLIAVDVSGSISNRDLQVFYSVINRFFKYGIKQISVIQFDTEIKGEALVFKKAKREIKICGRGGTSFQPTIDYFSANYKCYDGLIIFTDGYAETPVTSPKISHKTLWITNNKENYERHKTWMNEKGKCAWIE